MALPTLLAGETPDATKWATILSFLPQSAIVGSDQPLNASSTTLQNVTSLVVTPLVSATYEVMVLIYASNSAGTTEDIKIAASFPAGATLKMSALGGTPAGIVANSASDMNVAEQTMTSGTTAFGFGASTSPVGILLLGTLAMGATSGNLQIMAAQNTSGTNITTVLAGSYVKLTRLG